MPSRSIAMIAILALSLSGCGGGGGDAEGPPPVQINPTPTPSPTPTPTPASVFPPAPFGLTHSQTFNPQGSLLRNRVAQQEPLSAATLLLDWNAITKRYQLTLPDVGTGHLEYNFPGNNPVSFKLIGANGALLSDRVTLFFGQTRPGRGPLAYTAFIYWSGTGPFTVGQAESLQAAFGIETLAAQVPASGLRSYRTYGDSAGDAQLTFDFAARTAGGWIDLAYVDGWAEGELSRYTLNNVTWTDAVTFSGSFAIPGAPTGGSFTGRFMGPQAQEFTFVYQGWVKSPYDGAWERTSGVLAGPACPATCA